MTTLLNKIIGMSIWAYDIARRPVKDLNTKGNPQLLNYALDDTKKYGVVPVTQHPTEYVDKLVNEFWYVYDETHQSDKTPLKLHGIRFNPDSTGDVETTPTSAYLSTAMYGGCMFVDDEIYLTGRSEYSGAEIQRHRMFSTPSNGINVLNQTGIVNGSYGDSAIVFEVQSGYKIPAGNIIKVNGFSENYTATGKALPPINYKVNYDMNPGIYLISTHNNGNWVHANVDYDTTKGTAEKPTSNITFDLEHCTVSPDETKVFNGKHSWTFTASTGYIFDQDGGIVNPETGSVGREIQATDTNVTSLNDYDVEKDTTIKLTANPMKDPTIAIKQELGNAKSNVKGDTISRKLNAIVLTAEDLNLFQNGVKVTFYHGKELVSEYNILGNNESTITIPLNTTKENTITDYMDKVIIHASATEKVVDSGYEHNYLITKKELGAFSKDTLLKFTGHSEELEPYDFAKFVNGLIELPFKVDVPTHLKQISVGNTLSSVVSNETDTRFVTLDLGKITIPPKYNNGYDYQNRTVKLYTPFVDPITINNENAIDKSIHIIYKVDISKGDLTVNLYNDDLLFFTGTHNIASQLPFLTDAKNSIINRNSHFNDNDIRKPYLVITRETPILNNDYYPTIERGLIKNYNGNMKARLLNNINIPNNELSQLNNLLESGVKYVKSN